MKKAASRAESKTGGQLKIGDQWNAITIIALSQSNPLKAIAEFVENSIDAHAKRITIYRGKEAGAHYLRIVDDGDGISSDDEGKPNFKYVATHICDSIKRRLKSEGAKGIQGEFGIGLLSFWTVGEEMILRSTGKDGKTYQMSMSKGNSRYSVKPVRTLVAHRGTELQISPLLPGLRQFSGEKIQWYLASELRNRIIASGVDIRIIDRTSKSEYRVEPRKYTGRRIQIPDSPEIQAAGLHAELYLDEPKAENHVSVYRMGTRVVDSVLELEEFQVEVFRSGYIQGMIDCPRLNLTPGTRLGIIRDSAFEIFVAAVQSILKALAAEVSLQQNAEEARASRNTLFSIQRAFKEALHALPVEEYDWFDLRVENRVKKAGFIGAPENPLSPSDGATIRENGYTQGSSSENVDADTTIPKADESDEIESAEEPQKAFFDFPGPLHSVRVSPGSSLVSVNQKRTLRAVARDRKGKAVHDGLTFEWSLIEGGGALTHTDREIVDYVASAEPGLIKIGVQVKQDGLSVRGQSIVTVTDSLVEAKKGQTNGQGIPGYTFQRAPGETWRSRFDENRNLVVINNGHRDFVYAAKNNTQKLRYLCRLFTKELVMKNFPGSSPSELLERLIEVGLYAEENLR